MENIHSQCPRDHQDLLFITRCGPACMDISKIANCIESICLQLIKIDNGTF
jgi:hypothetical protein